MYLRVLLVSILALCSSLVAAQQLGDFIYSSDVAPVQEFHVGDLWYQIYQIQLQIAQHQLSGTMILVQDNVLTLLTSLKSLSSYRVIDVMQKSQNKAEVFDTYLSAMQSSLYVTNAAELQINSEINSISSDLSLCEAQKKQYDRDYTNALQESSPTQNLDPIVLSAQMTSSCIAKNTTLLSAKKQMLESLYTQSSLVGQRYDYLSKQRDTILSHFDLLDSNYLQNVLDIQQNIQEGNY